MGAERPGSGSGAAQFLLLVAIALGIVAVLATFLFVSLPDGLKFVVAAIAGMLTLMCGALLVLAQLLDRSSR